MKNKTMNEETNAANRDPSDNLIEHAQALIAATADVAGDRIKEARKRLAAALEGGKGVCGRVHEKAVEGARMADATMHDHPYKAAAIGVGVGLLSGLLLSRRCTCKCQ
jgi:ElaB/YqjD/DUF883 family membrane-anchored ribosome-binding protein